MEVLISADRGHTPTRPITSIAREATELQNRFDTITCSDQVTWPLTYRMIRPLGAGGQGVVFLADRLNPHGLSFRLALKFHRPDIYEDVSSYRADMARVARVANALAQIQQDHIVDIFNFVETDGIQVMVMEWIDGIDLAHLLRPGMLERIRQRVDQEHFDYVNDVVVTPTQQQLRLKAGVANAILRECLAGLAGLHRRGIIHADLKPANVMVKRTGNCKVIDVGSAFLLDDLPYRPTWTPRYAAVEVLEGERHTPQSDLASLGYVFVEMLSGRYPFADAESLSELIERKRNMCAELPRLLPEEVSENEFLLRLIRQLVDPDPAKRFASAEEAAVGEEGAAEFERQLIMGDLASVYQNEIRSLLEKLD